MDQLGEMEQSREIHLSSACVAALDVLQMPQDETQKGEPQMGVAGKIDNVNDSGATNDRNDNVKCIHAVTTSINLDCCEPQIQQCVINHKENISKIDLPETEKHSINVDGGRNDSRVLHHVSAERQNRKKGLENSNFLEEPVLQLQNKSQDVTKIFPNYLATKMVNTELICKTLDRKEVEVETSKTEGVSTESQVQTNSPLGRKKRKKRKGKKKGKANEESERDINEDGSAENYEGLNQLQLTAVDDVLATEVCIKSRTFTDTGKTKPQQIEAKDPEGKEKYPKPAVQSKTLEDLQPGGTKNKCTEGQTAEEKIVFTEEYVKTYDICDRPKDIHTEHKKEDQNEAGWVEIENFDKGDVRAKKNDLPTSSKTLKEPTMVVVTKQGDEVVNLKVKSAEVASEVEDIECMAATTQVIAIEKSHVLEIYSSQTGGVEERTKTTENHSEFSEECEMTLLKEEQCLVQFRTSLETNSSTIPVPPDDSRPCNASINDVGRVKKLSPNNHGDLKDSVMANRSADSWDAKDNTNFLESKSESQIDKVKYKENVESLIAMQPDENTNIIVSICQNAEESEEEAVAAKKKYEGLAGESAVSTDLDHVMVPNLVPIVDNTMLGTQVDCNDGELATGVQHKSERTQIVDASEAINRPSKSDVSTKRQSTDCTSEGLNPSLSVLEVDDENDEGQSFNYDNLDLEVAFAAKSQLKDEEERQYGAYNADIGSDPDQSDSKPKENVHQQVIGIQSEKGVNYQVDFQETAPASNDVTGNVKNDKVKLDNQLAKHWPVTDENPDQNQTSTLVIDESVDAARHQKLPDEQAASVKDPLNQQARKDSKKNSKKGKTKGKEDCKMS